MKRAQLVIIFLIILGLTGYLIYANLVGPSTIVTNSDSMVLKELENKAPHFCLERVPIENDRVYKRLQAEMNILLTYKHHTQKLIDKADYWLPRFSARIKKFHLPDDIKYLAVIESHLSNVVSGRGAAGFWQFMKTAGRRMGLEINGEIDERFHPMKSANAACRYLDYAYGQLNNWTNVIASYNYGISGIQKKLKRQKQTSYYNLRLNKETARYVYKAIAFKLVFENREAYGFKKNSGSYLKLRTDNVPVYHTVNNLLKFSDSLGVKYHELLSYNPWLRQNTLTIKTKSKYYILEVPKATNQ